MFSVRMKGSEHFTVHLEQNVHFKLEHCAAFRAVKGKIINTEIVLWNEFSICLAKIFTLVVTEIYLFLCDVQLIVSETQS